MSEAGPGWADICAAGKRLGLTYAALSGDFDGFPQTHAGGDCVFCNVHADALGLSPSGAGRAALSLLSFQPPLGQLSVLALRTAWLAADARGPPGP